MHTFLQASSLRATGSEVLIKLPKKEYARWPRVTKQEKLPFIALDFDRWDETSSSELDIESKYDCVYLSVTMSAYVYETQ